MCHSYNEKRKTDALGRDHTAKQPTDQGDEGRRRWVQVVLEVEGIKHLEMKELVRKEYFRRVKKILKSKLNGGNTIKAINSRAVSIIPYGAGIVDWTKEELQEMDRKTRKLLTINRALHPQADVDRLYLKRSEGGRGMIGVEDCVTIETNSLMSYIKQHANEKALKAVAREQVLKVRREGIDKKSLREERREKYLAKPLHGQFFRGTENRDERSWEWLKRGKLKKETEGLLFAAQDQALRTNSVKSRIDKQDVSPSCRMCGERKDTSLQNVKCSHRSIIRTGDTTRWRKWYTGDYARVMDSKAGTFGTSTSPSQ